MKPLHIAISVIIVLIIIIIVLLHKYSSQWDNYLEGMWKSTDEFAELASIDEAWLYLGDKISPCTRLGYLVMYGDGQLIFNKKFKLKTYSSLGYLNPIKRKVKLEFEEEEDYIPPNLNMELDIIAGKLILEKDGEIYLSVMKNNEDSEYGKYLNSGDDMNSSDD